MCKGDSVQDGVCGRRGNVWKEGDIVCGGEGSMQG